MQKKTIFSSFNPSTGDKIWEGEEASNSDVNLAVQNAQIAFKKWSSLSFSNRSHFLIRFSEILKAKKTFFAETISLETGKPLWESIAETDSMINKVSISIDAYSKRCLEITEEIPSAMLMTRHRPHGVLAVLGPYNFPGHLPNGHIVPALLAGNCVILKPSELTPKVAEEMLKIWSEAELPAGVIQLVQGGRSVGEALVQHPNIQGVLFTGSYSTGQFLASLFANQPSKILALEMGGNNPLIIGDITNIPAAAYIAMQSAYLTSGQRCTCARRIIIPNSSVGEKFVTAFVELTNKISIGPYTDNPEPFMGPVISEQHLFKMLKAQEFLQSMGGHMILKMRQLVPKTGFVSPGLMDVTSIAVRPDEEIFGPFVQLIRVNNFKEGVEEANRTQYGLSAGLISENREEYAYFLQHIQAGVVNWNTPLTGASSRAPFGGIKNSGNHRPSAFYAADYCSYPVASMENSKLTLPINVFPCFM